MSFYTDVIQNDRRYTSIDPVRDLALLEPVTRAAVKAIIAEAAAAGVTLVVTETYRSKERQAHLFTTGKRQLKDVGIHHYGLAADFCKIVDGKASWDGDWKFLRDLAGKHGLISGLDWGHPKQQHSFCDSDHVQRCAVDQQPELFAGTWNPPEETDGIINA